MNLPNLVNLYISEQIEIYVPSLWYYEIGNILKIKEFLKNLKDLNFIECENTSEIETIILKLCSKNTRISFYDASYHGIAQYLNADLITADRKYYECIKNEGSIILLEEVKL